MLAVTGICLVGFAGIALWQVRRAVRDLSASERLAWKLAHEDMLTGLPNHRKMIELIDRALAGRTHGEVVTLAFLDLDGLKDINDALGHRAGDELLIAFATRIRDLLPAGAFCGRFDGDEFAVVMTAPDTDAAEAVTATLTGSLARPFWIAEQVVQVGVTAGLCHAPRDTQARDELMRRTDLALRAAKKKQRGGIAHFEPAMDCRVRRSPFPRKRAAACDREQVARRALPADRVVRRPSHRRRRGLLRWTHPVRGPIPPMQFVAVAEHAGLMVRLGEFVLRRALSDARRWPDLYMAVNLSPVQVRDPALVELVSDILAKNDIAPSRLMLEVTEGVLIDNPDEAKARLDA